MFLILLAQNSKFKIPTKYSCKPFFHTTVMMACHLFNQQVVFHLLSFFLCTDELTAEELKEWCLQGQPTYSHLPSWVSCLPPAMAMVLVVRHYKGGT